MSLAIVFVFFFCPRVFFLFCPRENFFCVLSSGEFFLCSVLEKSVIGLGLGCFCVSLASKVVSSTSPLPNIIKLILIVFEDKVYLVYTEDILLILHCAMFFTKFIMKQDYENNSLNYTAETS